MAKRKINYDLVKDVTKGAHLAEQGGIRKSSEQIVKIPLDALKENPYQPRIEIDSEYIEELANSIRENGLIQPITVVKNGDAFTILYGHRRVAAHHKLKKDSIKAIVKEDADKAEMAIKPLVENIQRQDMNPIETVISLKRILDDEIVKSQSDLAKLLGVSKGWISKMFSVLKLPKEVIQVVRSDGYKDVDILARLNTLQDNHMDVYNVVKTMDRKGARVYIKKISGKTQSFEEKRVEKIGNKIVINMKNLSESKKEEIQEYLGKIEEILS